MQGYQMEKCCLHRALLPGAKKLLLTVSPTLYMLMSIRTCQEKFTH